jgi:hypothetical protein
LPAAAGENFRVMITAAVAYVFAIPANSTYWRMEIWKRGGAAWTYDKNGHLGWKWMVDPIPRCSNSRKASCGTVISRKRSYRAAVPMQGRIDLSFCQASPILRES